MSQVKNAKEHCGYIEKPVHRTCANCAGFASGFAYPRWCKTVEDRAAFDRHYLQIEKNMRCTDHGFAVKKGATCVLWRSPTTPAAKV